MHPTGHKVIITGIGRTGTTFLVQLLTELGLDTGYTPATWRRDYFEHCSAGLERDIENPKSPYIVKDPELCATLAAILARGSVVIDHAIVPVRVLDDAARSRIRIGGDGTTPGGLLDTADPAQLTGMLAERFHELVHTLTAHDIPHTFLLFPRFATDADYTYAKLCFLFPEISREQFHAAFARVARPELIHDFNQPSAVARAGAAALAYALATARKEQRKRWRRRVRRWIGAGSLAAAAAWIIAMQGSTRMRNTVTHATPPAAFSPASLDLSAGPSLAWAEHSFNRPPPPGSVTDLLYLSPGRQRFGAWPPSTGVPLSADRVDRVDRPE